MKLFALVGAALVVFCQVASGFVIAPSAFAGSSVVSERCLVAGCVVESRAPHVDLLLRSLSQERVALDLSCLHERGVYLVSRREARAIRSAT